MKQWHNGFSLLIIPLILFSFCSAIDTITPTQPLSDNETLVSSNGLFALGFFTPTNSNNRYLGLWYNQITVQMILWVANRDDPISNSRGTLLITINGTLTITNQNSIVIWSVNTARLTNPIAKLLDTGNFVVKEDGNDSKIYAWQGFDYPTDTLIPGMKLGIDYTRGHSWFLTAWRSDHDPSSGQQYLELDTSSGDPEISLNVTKFKEWRSGPWDGIQFNGIPEMVQSFKGGETFSLVNTSKEVAYSYQVTDQSIMPRLVVNQSGIVQHWVWGRNQWNLSWFAPEDKCDEIGQCGPFGICNPVSSEICSCLPGFVPISSGDWILVHGSIGCTRQTPLDCQPATTDGFVIVEGVIWGYELSDIKQYNGGGQTLYVRLAAADLAPIKSHKRRIKMAAIIVCPLVGILLSGTCYFLWKRKKWRKGVDNYFNDGGNVLDLPVVAFDAIAAATDNFAAGNKLGEGGFGPVYKGKLGGDQEAAVKRLCKTSQQGADEFRYEVMLIAKLQHRNLVRLLGCCIQGEERMLIYEYMPNKSLDVFLFGKDEITLLSWRTRYRIIIGIARGLLYLHQDSRFRIIHRDLKASNILLDKDMNPKISDFGMARIFGGDETDLNTRKVVGTYGYMAPEYALGGTFSMKSDIFSFGVLVLEIISGRKNRGLGVYGAKVIFGNLFMKE